MIYWGLGCDEQAVVGEHGVLWDVEGEVLWVS